MKAFAPFKLPLILGGLVAALAFSPACKAQSEISPDHFDGTDSWVAHAIAPAKSHGKLVARQLNDQMAPSSSALRLAGKRNSTAAAPRTTPPVRDPGAKRVARKSKTRQRPGSQ
jgi:hypothetical protein